MDKKQIIQEDQYDFPYHHLVTIDGRHFSQHKHLFWGYEYAAYIAFVLDLLKKMRFATLLDVGCGEGKLMIELRKTFPDADLTGVDYSAHSIAFARAFNPGLAFEAKDISSDDLGKRYDVITLIETLEHIPPQELPRFISGLARHLNPKGKLIIMTPTENVSVNPKHYQHFTKQKIENLCVEHFTIEQVYYTNKIGWQTQWLQRLLSNRVFILNSAALNNRIFKYYREHLFHGRFETTRRICVVLERCG